MRFEGTLNVDLNEITMNLVPFPRLHLLTASLAPLTRPNDLAFQPRRSADTEWSPSALTSAQNYADV